MQGFVRLAIIWTEKHTEIFTRRKILTKSMKREIYVKSTGSWCVLVEYAKDNYYARFHNPSYHRYKEKHFIILLDIKF